jgi:phage replication O-like protein O
MADVQKENGFIPIARELLEALIRAPIPGRHLKVMLAIADKTYGWQKRTDRIASSQLAEITGIDARHVRNILAELERWGMIYRSPRRGSAIRSMGIVKDFDLWLVPVAVQARKPPQPKKVQAPVPSAVQALVPSGVHTEAISILSTLPAARVGATAPSDLLELATREISEQLVNLLAKKPGTREAKVEWLDQNIDLMLAELEAEGVQDPLRNFGALKRRIFRWYNQTLKNPGGGKPVAESFEERRVRQIREWAQGGKP